MFNYTPFNKKMITLSEIKEYLKITDTTLDVQLKAFINMAKKRAETITNRKLEYQMFIETYKGDNTSELTLLNSPVVLEDIILLQYYDYNTKEYIDLISYGEDTIYNVCEIVNNDTIRIKRDYTFSGLIRVVYRAGYKATKIYKSITDIVQENDYAVVTIGNHSYEIGTVFYIEGVKDFLNNPNGSQVIADVTDTQVLIAFDLGSGTYSSGGIAEFDYNLVNTTPEDIKTALKYLVQKYFYDSPIGQNVRAGIQSKNIGGQSSSGETYKDIEESEVIRLLTPYKYINV